MELIEEIENKSSREVEKYLLSMRPDEEIASEKVRATSESLVEMRFVVSDKFKNKLDQVRLLLSHVNPNFSNVELLNYLLDKELKRLDPEIKKTKELIEKTECIATPAPEVANENKIIKNARYIPAHIRRAVWKRDHGCCTFMDSKSKRKCGSKFQVQFDHVQPFALGGTNEESNIRLLCANHNRWRVRKTWGRAS